MRSIAIVSLCLMSGLAVAQSGAVDHAARHAAAPFADPAAGMAEGEVRRVDRDAGKVTLRHGPIPSLGMSEGMTMVFRVADATMLDGVKPGDKVRFKADKIGGQYTVTAWEPVR